MREAPTEDVRLDVDTTRTTGRKRRLRRGIERWHQSTCASWRSPKQSPSRSPTENRGRRHRYGKPLPNKIRSGGVALGLLSAQPDFATAYGAARNFWKQLSDKYGDLTYFCWLELTAAGAPHYHFLLVNPPRGFFAKHNRSFLEQAWGNRFVRLQWRDAAWFKRSGGAYATNYVKKMGTKSYQQSYEDVPRELRTFMSNRYYHQVADLDAHRDHAEVRFVPESYNHDTRLVEAPYLAVNQYIRHQGEPCRLPRVTIYDERRIKLERAQKRRGSHSVRGGLHGTSVLALNQGFLRDKTRTDVVAPFVTSRALHIPPQLDITYEGHWALTGAGHPTEATDSDLRHKKNLQSHAIPPVSSGGHERQSAWDGQPSKQS